MSDILQQAKEKLRYDYGLPTIEWEVLSTLLEKESSRKDDLLKWVFEEYDGYIETRSRAGILFLNTHPEQGWAILEKLIVSNKPDDRQTALTVLVDSKDPRAPEIVKPLLKDDWPYVKLDAAEYLKAIYPKEVMDVLRLMLNHEEIWVRDQARKLLEDMKGE